MSTTEEPIQYDDAYSPEVGVGPHPLPWPQAARYDPQLLAEGDRRNVADHYRYWTRQAIVAASWCGPPKTASEAVPGRRGATGGGLRPSTALVGNA